jgi:hypothetical protein
MASHKPGIHGDVGGNPISPEAATKIQDVLKTTLQKELQASKPTTGAVLSHHGSITHGSVELA